MPVALTEYPLNPLVLDTDPVAAALDGVPHADVRWSGILLGRRSRAGRPSRAERERVPEPPFLGTWADRLVSSVLWNVSESRRASSASSSDDPCFVTFPEPRSKLLGGRRFSAGKDLRPSDQSTVLVTGRRRMKRLAHCASANLNCLIKPPAPKPSECSSHQPSRPLLGRARRVQRLFVSTAVSPSGRSLSGREDAKVVSIPVPEVWFVA